MARFNPLILAVLSSAFILSSYSLNPLDLSHIPTDPLCFTPLAGGQSSGLAASYIYDAASFFHPNPQRLVIPQQIPTEITQNPLVAAVMPYAQQYMSHRTKASKGVGEGLGDGTSNTTVHAWFIIFLVILGGLAWTAHHTVKSADAEEKKKLAEQAEKERLKRSLVVGPLEEIQLPIDEDVQIIREEDQNQNEGNDRYVNPNYYSVHEGQENNGYTQQQNNSYYENQEVNAQYTQNQGGANDEYERIQGSSTFDPEERGEIHHHHQHQGYQPNGQYYDDRQALGQYGASQGPSDYDGQANQYGNYQYDDDQDLANLVDDDK
jgi:hypothetical protein